METVLNEIPKEMLLECIEGYGYIEEQLSHDDIFFRDILVFFNKYSKDENDKTNKLRELIIEKILNNKIPKRWLSSPQWYKVALRLKEFVAKLNTEVNGNLKSVLKKAGRKFNYDFLFVFDNTELKIEFKNNVKLIDEYPEILSVSSNNFVTGITYAEFFYDNYLNLLSDQELPTKDFYLKNIHKNKVNHPFFIKLKEIDTFKVIVDESIDNYLQNFLKFDFNAFNEKIKNQIDKKFMLWNGEEFILDSIDEIDILPEFTLKKGRNGFNTVVLVSGKTEYHLLLRWKNHAGVLFPAWQIKLKRNK